MHKIICCLLLSFGFLTLLSAQSDDKVLMTVGDIPVTVGEFKYIYEKNNGNDADYSKESVDEYLELYKKFKLKVAKAKDEKLDTISALREELRGYRHQLASSFLTENEVLDNLLKEAYERKKVDVEVAHIFLPTNKRMSEEDKKTVRNEIKEIKSKLDNGLAWKDAVNQYSKDKFSKDKQGNIGFLNAPLPKGFYELEDAIYSLPIGKYGDVVETRMGYHIPKVISKRDARGIIKVSQILIKSDVKGSVENTQNKSKAEAAYKELKAGAKWEDVLEKYASEGNSKKLNGAMDEFGIGIYERDFENAAFGLEKDGDISKPVETRLGYHVLRREYKSPFPSYEDFEKTFRASFKNRNRFKIAEDRMIDRFLEDAGHTVNDKLINDFIATLDDGFYSFKWRPDTTLRNDVLLTVGKHKYDLNEFTDFIRKNTRLRSQLGKGYDLTKGVNKLLEEFKREKALYYAEENLENENSDFRSLMREYNEGVLLFEITKNNVWDKASTDTVGLKKFFEENMSDYMWKDRATVQKYMIAKGYQNKVSEIHRYAQNHTADEVLKKFNTDKDIIRVQEAQYEKDHSSFDQTDFRVGATSPITSKSKTGVTEFMVITDIENARQKSLSEARGYVIADYQELLEKEWIEQLEKEYKIKVNKKVLKSLIKK